LEGVSERWSGTLPGKGGALCETLDGTGGGCPDPNGMSWVEAGDFGGNGGGAMGVPEDRYICSLGGRAGAVSRDGEFDHLS
jgi:hypothetical protein